MQLKEKLKEHPYITWSILFIVMMIIVIPLFFFLFNYIWLALWALKGLL